MQVDLNIQSFRTPMTFDTWSKYGLNIIQKRLKIIETSRMCVLAISKKEFRIVTQNVADLMERTAYLFVFNALSLSYFLPFSKRSNE